MIDIDWHHSLVCSSLLAMVHAFELSSCEFMIRRAAKQLKSAEIRTTKKFRISIFNINLPCRSKTQKFTQKFSIFGPKMINFYLTFNRNWSKSCKNAAKIWCGPWKFSRARAYFVEISSKIFRNFHEISENSEIFEIFSKIPSLTNFRKNS